MEGVKDYHRHLPVLKLAPTLRQQLVVVPLFELHEIADGVK